MGHFTLENETPLALEPLALADEELRPLLVLVVKATYRLGRGEPVLAEEQIPVNVSGEPWGKAGESSYRYEPECAFIKQATDVVLVGHAHAPEPGMRELLAGVQVGPVQRIVRVVGERVWFRSLGAVEATRPLPFDRMPLLYERAFGGWDRTNPEQPTFEPRNPVGVGFRASPRHFEEGLRLPNIEDPEQPLRRFGQVVPPAGLGFISPHWQPRTAYAGTYDESWHRQRKPLLPRDFDRRFFNAASPGLVAPGHLRGGEPCTLLNVSPLGRLAFSLPRLVPTATVARARTNDLRLEPRLDTLIFDMDEHQLLMLWRASVVLRDGPLEVRGIRLRVEGLPEGRGS